MRSDIIKKGFEKAPHRSLLKATAVKDEDFAKPFIGVCNSFIEIIPGHVHLQDAFGYPFYSRPERTLTPRDFLNNTHDLFPPGICLGFDAIIFKSTTSRFSRPNGTILCSPT